MVASFPPFSLLGIQVSVEKQYMAEMMQLKRHPNRNVVSPVTDGEWPVNPINFFLNADSCARSTLSFLLLDTFRQKIIVQVPHSPRFI